MKSSNRIAAALLGLAAALAVLAPVSARACACGCGIFDVQTDGRLPTTAGGSVFMEYDYLDQDRNWSGTSPAPVAGNMSRRISTQFITTGVRYMAGRSGGFSAELPVWKRRFLADDGSGGVMGFGRTAVGDARIKGYYTGFSRDMSKGLFFGLKLPSGDRSFSSVDRDMQIGTGSTDLLLGGHAMGALDGSGRWVVFAQAQWSGPILIADGYRPGEEVNGALGVYFNGLQAGPLKLAPMLQAVASRRARDSGSASDPDNSGYRRLVLSPGLELDAAGWKLNASFGVPVYQDVRGMQLAASKFYKLAMSFGF